MLAGMLDSLFGGGISSAAKATQRTAIDASQAITEAEGAIRQSRQVLTTTEQVAEDIDTYVQRISSIPVEELARRLDYRTMVATNELLSLSSFIKKSLLYLCAIAALFVYLDILTKD